MQAGFIVEGRLPIMTCGPGDPVAITAKDITADLARVDEDLMEAAEVRRGPSAIRIPILTGCAG
jgi:hypothetical protein